MFCNVTHSSIIVLKACHQEKQLFQQETWEKSHWHIWTQTALGCGSVKLAAVGTLHKASLMMGGTYISLQTPSLRNVFVSSLQCNYNTFTICQNLLEGLNLWLDTNSSKHMLLNNINRVGIVSTVWASLQICHLSYMKMQIHGKEYVL